MEFFEVMNSRHSVRNFTQTPVETDKLQMILETANNAPSAGNLQAYEIYIVSAPGRKNALAKAALDQTFIAEAAVNLVFCAHPARSGWRYGKRGKRMYALQDATIACSFAMLASTALGLGCVWVGAFDDKTVQSVLGIPTDIIPVAILPIGYAAESPTSTSRRDLEDLVHQVS
jgi:nitroreductase